MRFETLTTFNPSNHRQYDLADRATGLLSAVRLSHPLEREGLTDVRLQTTARHQT